MDRPARHDLNSVDWALKPQNKQNFRVADSVRQFFNSFHKLCILQHELAEFIKVADKVSDPVSVEQIRRIRGDN